MPSSFLCVLGGNKFEAIALQNYPAIQLTLRAEAVNIADIVRVANTE